MAPIPSRRALAALAVLLTALGWSAMPYAADAAPAPESAQPASSQPASSPCEDMVAKDDGSVESGYGFVPSATVGNYVQAFDRSQLQGDYLTSVCLCFLKTRGDRDIEFEVVVFADRGGRPAAEPVVWVAGTQTGVAGSKETAGAFVEIPMPDVRLPPGTVYIGARWNPSEEQFLFLCNDQSPTDPKTPAFFSENPRAGWSSVFSAKDPIFRPHRALMVRARASAEPLGITPQTPATPPKAEMTRPDASASPAVGGADR